MAESDRFSAAGECYSRRVELSRAPAGTENNAATFPPYCVTPPSTKIDLNRRGKGVGTRRPRTRRHENRGRTRIRLNRAFKTGRDSDGTEDAASTCPESAEVGGAPGPIKAAVIAMVSAVRS